jgi:A/G-specific adenine glycosylase
MKRFPTVKKLAQASVDEVLAEWAGLGYYSRARNLHFCAQQVVDQFSGEFPSDPDLLEQLKGIGRSTAGAIAAFAFHGRAPILDANVKRILARLFCIEGPLQDKVVNDQLWVLAGELLPADAENMPVYTQALMDFGATWCSARKPVCVIGEKKCPFAKECQANLSGQVLLFPQKTVKAKSPEFACNMLLMRHKNFILLERRPSRAIWGGLWSLPESDWFPRDKSVETQSSLNLKTLLTQTLVNEDLASLIKFCTSVQRGEQIKHVFTHRRLWMQIWHVSALQAFSFTQSQLQWVPLARLGEYGLPQPIKVLLQRLSLVRDGDLKS